MAVDSCFVCGLLEPERLGQCERCGGRVRYRPARFADDVAVDEAVERAVAAFRASADRTAFEALAELLFEVGDEAVARCEVPLDELRAWWAEHGAA